MGSRRSEPRSCGSGFGFQGVVTCLFCVLCLSVSTISADQSGISDAYSLYPVVDVERGEVGSVVSAPADSAVDLAALLDEPLAVYAVDPVAEDSSLVRASGSRPFYGSTWIEGTASGLGSGTLYLPINYQSGYLGLTSGGTLINVYSSSLTGYFYTDSGSVYTVAMAFASTPRYRLSSNYDQEDFLFTPSGGNAVIAESDSNLASFEYLVPFVSLVFLGVIFICCLNKSRR